MSLVNTLTQSLRTTYPNNLDKNEQRLSRYGAWDFFQKDTNAPMSIMTPDIRSKIKQSFGNSVVVPVIDGEDVAIGNVRSCTVADVQNVSRLVTLTFITYAFGFSMYPAQHYNNDISYQADYDRKLLKYLARFASTLDNQSIATLEAQKNQFWTGVAPEFYTQIGGALQISQANKNDFYNNASAILEQMDFYGAPQVIHNTYHKPLFNRLLNQGAQNDANQQFQFSPFTFWGTNRIASGVGIQSAGYLVQEGSVAVENRNDPDAIMKSNVGTQMQWDEVMMPIVNLNMGSFYREDCNDANALHAGTAGLTRTKRESFAFSTDLCFMTVYNRNIANRFNPFVKFQVTTA